MDDMSTEKDVQRLQRTADTKARLLRADAIYEAQRRHEQMQPGHAAILASRRATPLTPRPATAKPQGRCRDHMISIPGCTWCDTPYPENLRVEALPDSLSAWRQKPAQESGQCVNHEYTWMQALLPSSRTERRYVKVPNLQSPKTREFYRCRQKQMYKQHLKLVIPPGSTAVVKEMSPEEYNKAIKVADLRHQFELLMIGESGSAGTTTGQISGNEPLGSPVEEINMDKIGEIEGWRAVVIREFTRKT